MISSLKETTIKKSEESLSQVALEACPDCDLLMILPDNLPDAHYLACGRCGKTVSKSYNDSLSKVLALSFAGLLLYLPAMFLPLMTLSSIGIREKGNVVDTFISFLTSGYYLVALIVLCTAIIFPFLKLFLPFAVTLSLKLNHRPSWLKSGFKLLKHLEEWGMVEVYLLGILITLIKMGGMASIDYNAGFFCFVALVLLSMAASVSLDEHAFWSSMGNPHDRQELIRINQVKVELMHKPDLLITAAQLGLKRCHDCGLLIDSSTAADTSDSNCPRCNSAAHIRTTNSIVKTWALVLTSLILFFPANILPIMQVNFLGVPDRSTILDGILYFFKEGSYGIGLIILTASILVPLFKVIGMMIILLTIKYGSTDFLKQKAKMFRFIEFIGRWSMLDIFVIALMTVLVNFGFLTSIHTAPAATYFTMVVVSTMIAALVFDPRIMWDRCDPTEPHHLDQRG